MGLFSKLFGEKAGIIDDIAEAKRQASKDRQERASSNVSAADASVSTADKKAPSGFSWGPEMPDEENQYNYSGTYKEYFDHVFRSEFPSYKIESSDFQNGKRSVFTFWDGSRKALVVELVSRRSSVYKTLTDCKNEGVPYLRYYYDYHGWWNTREYVKQRTGKALKG